MASHPRKIGYLAPEAPALSATFVTGEILELRRMGYEVVLISIHRPQTEVDIELGKVYYLYETPLSSMILSHLRRLQRSPLRYLKTLCRLAGDIWSAGVATRLACGLVYRFLYAVVLVDILESEGCQHLHVHFAHVPADVAMYASLCAGVPFSVTSHANDLFQRGWLLKQKGERSSFMATISQYNLRFLLDQGVPEAKLHLVRCGVAPDQFSPIEPRSVEQPPKIGALGRMVPKKGFEDLIRAAGMLRDQGVDFSLEIAGDGPQGQALKNLVKSLDLESRVRFIGAMAHTDVPRWLKSLDIFTLPCKVDPYGDMDGIPVVLMEAMLSGIPVVSTDISGVPELVVPCETGGLARPGCPESLAHEIEKMLHDTELRERCRERAIEKVKMEFQMSKNVQRLAALFEGGADE